MEPILVLADAITADLKEDSAGPNVRNLMLEYVKNHNDWTEYMHFNDLKYARNLIASNDVMELMLICWLPAQVSPIHNHAGQHCWAAVMEGTIQETHYCYKNTLCCSGSGPLKKTKEHTFDAGNVSYINDDIALHVLRPIGEKRGITLHLYSRPIAQCNIYCPDTGKVTPRKLGFYSINKKIQPPDQQQCCGSSSITTASVSTCTGPSKAACGSPAITNG